MPELNYLEIIAESKALLNSIQINQTSGYEAMCHYCHKPGTIHNRLDTKNPDGSPRISFEMCEDCYYK